MALNNNHLLSIPIFYLFYTYYTHDIAVWNYQWV